MNEILIKRAVKSGLRWVGKIGKISQDVAERMQGPTEKSVVTESLKISAPLIDCFFWNRLTV